MDGVRAETSRPRFNLFLKKPRVLPAEASLKVAAHLDYSLGSLILNPALGVTIDVVVLVVHEQLTLQISGTIEHVD